MDDEELELGERSELELKFDALWRMLYPDIDLYIEEKLIPNRKFAFDYVNKESKVAIEINGGVWAKGNSGHSSGSGIIRDYKKNNLAILEGYVVFQLSGEMIEAEWLDIIAQSICDRAKCGHTKCSCNE